MSEQWEDAHERISLSRDFQRIPAGYGGRRVDLANDRLGIDADSDLNERAVHLLRPSPSDRVLEVGFGLGRAVARLANIVEKGCACGIDVSESMLNMAVRPNRRAVAAGRVLLRKGDCASIPFANANFDGRLPSTPCISGGIRLRA